MTIRYNRQYRPLATNETASQDPLSTRLRDLGEGINNAKGRVMCPRILVDAWPGGNAYATTATEDLLLPPLAPRWVGAGYNKVTWTVCAKNDQASNNATFTLYCGDSQYQGPITSVTAADAQSMGRYSSGTLTFTTTSWDVKTTTFDFPFYDGGMSHWLITGKCDDAANNCTMIASTITVLISSGA